MYAVRHTEVHLPEPEQEEPDSPPVSEFDPGEVYDEGYYVAVIAMADEAEWWGRCFNCGKEGHRWAECTEPLRLIEASQGKSKPEKTVIKPG